MPIKHRVVVINAHPKRVIHKNPIEQLVHRVLEGERKKVRELNIVFVDDREITRLNRKFLNHYYTTDVISFRLDNDEVLDGEVYVNLNQAYRQAREYNVAVRDEVKRLVIHGVLHLVGYNDCTKVKKEIMHSLENKYLKWKNR